MKLSISPRVQYLLLSFCTLQKSKDDLREDAFGVAFDGRIWREGAFVRRIWAREKMTKSLCAFFPWKRGAFGRICGVHLGAHLDFGEMQKSSFSSEIWYPPIFGVADSDFCIHKCWVHLPGPFGWAIWRAVWANFWRTIWGKWPISSLWKLAIAEGVDSVRRWMDWLCGIGVAKLKFKIIFLTLFLRLFWTLPHNNNFLIV
jgi:hypothetical protein